MLDSLTPMRIIRNTLLQPVLQHDRVVALRFAGSVEQRQGPVARRPQQLFHCASLRLQLCAVTPFELGPAGYIFMDPLPESGGRREVLGS